jgi:hypothetical protein
MQHFRLYCLETTAGFVTVERVPDAKLFAAKATMVHEHFWKVLGLDVVLDVVLGLVLEVGAEAAAPHPLLRLRLPPDNILVEMFRAAQEGA